METTSDLYQELLQLKSSLKSQRCVKTKKALKNFISFLKGSFSTKKILISCINYK